MALLYASVAAAAFVAFLYWFVTRNFNYWKDRGVVGPAPVPLFGNLKASALRRQFIGVNLKEVYDQYPNEKVVGMYRMTSPSLLLRDLDIIKHVMIKDFDLFTDRGLEFSKEGLGMNLFHSDGEAWRILRNRFTPLFTSGKLKNMLYLMAERGDEFLKYVDSLCDKQNKVEQNIVRLVQKYTMSTITACAFGLDIDTFYNEIPELRKVDDLTFTATYTIELDMMFPGILKKLNIDILPRFIKSYFDDLVQNIIRQRDGNPINRHDFMDLILELRKQGKVEGAKRTSEQERKVLEMTEDVISAQAFIFYAAGYETSATTMGFFFYEVSKRHDIQEKIIAEVDRVLEKYDGKVTYEAISELEYTYRAFEETLRLHPLIDPLQRNAKVDYPIPGTDIVIKKGMTVLISPSGIQRDPNIYPNPEKFDPDRFTPQNSGDRHSCAFLPFGVGPRNCIGMRFAKVQSLMCISKFFSKFRVDTCSNTPERTYYDPMRPIAGVKDGIKVNIIRR